MASFSVICSSFDKTIKTVFSDPTSYRHIYKRSPSGMDSSQFPPHSSEIPLGIIQNCNTKFPEKYVIFGRNIQKWAESKLNCGNSDGKKLPEIS